MQKFEFCRRIMAPNIEDARVQMRAQLELSKAACGDMLNALDERQVSRRPPYEKPNTLYYTVRAAEGKGRRIGAVTLVRKNGSWHRGVCILSESDTFNRAYARKESYRRALAASAGKMGLPIRSHRSDGSVDKSVSRFLVAIRAKPGNSPDDEPRLKMEFACQLTPYERHLISRRWPDGVS